MNPSLIHILTNSNPKDISKLYYKHRDAFLNFGKRYGADSDIMLDIYQDAFVVIRKHAIQGRLDQVDSSFKTYLFGIGKRMIYNYHKQHKHNVSLDPEIHMINDKIEEIDFDLTKEPSIEQKLLRTFFNKLGKRCQEMLTLFYYRGLTIDEIAEKSGYENTNVVSSQKSRCLKQLKEIINTAE
ncbi:RNA polymerase sigma factor [Aquimarina sp. AU474]|uniref:RNA polymerase sigma factor n=1 Tax=Aquimarina sp. AU474 TaxID=2108529 RepID=UPI001359952B|nr:sigma-70 family RNA polymerase sigma factor [Aquimarina sp. AU474]